MAKISVFTGELMHLPESGRMTGIYKKPVKDPVEVRLEGLAGDHQADRRVHGGPDKAVHLYPARHYVQLAARFPEIADQFYPGCMGENLSTPNMDEGDVRIGEVWRLGSALLQVCQPRSPCWKIDEKFATRGVAAFIAEESLVGWYWRVIQCGSIMSGDELELQIAAPEAFTLSQALELLQEDRPDLESLASLVATPGIANYWREKLDYRLQWLRKNG